MKRFLALLMLGALTGPVAAAPPAPEAWVAADAAALLQQRLQPSPTQPVWLQVAPQGAYRLTQAVQPDDRLYQPLCQALLQAGFRLVHPLAVDPDAHRLQYAQARGRGQVLLHLKWAGQDATRAYQATSSGWTPQTPWSLRQEAPADEPAP